VNLNQLEEPLASAKLVNLLLIIGGNGHRQRTERSRVSTVLVFNSRDFGLKISKLALKFPS